MPGLDRTGPIGQGPRSGRGLGLCNNPNADPEQLLGVGRGGRPRGGGRGRCFGGGRGFGGVRGYAARGAWEPASGNLDADPQALQGEIRALSDEVAALRAELAAAKGQQPELDNTDPADQD